MMAQRPHDQQQMLLAQDPYAAFALNQQMSQTAILDSNEHSMMDQFFSNPEEAMSEHGFSYANVDGTPNPFSVFAEVANSSSHANSRAHVEAAAHGYALGSNEAWLSSPSEVQNAASTLTSFHPGSHHNSGNMDYTGSWGNMSANNTGANMSPFYQSGRAADHNQQQQPPHSQYSYPMSGNNFPAQPTWQQPVQSQQFPNRARHLSLDTSSQAMQQQMQMPLQGMRSAMPEMQSRASTFTFGTDQSFSPSGYQAPDNKALLQDRDGDLLNIPYTALITNNTPAYPAQSASARPSIGNMGARNSHNNGARTGHAADVPRPVSAHHHGSSWDGGSRSFAADNNNNDELYDQQPRKRRKGRPDHEDDDHHAGNLSSAKKQAKMETSDDDRAPNVGGKRRKSAFGRGAAASPQSPASSDGEDDGEDGLPSSKKKDKKPRQNLSDVQKRQNHIMSEKKRRELIKTGYADLNELVPALVGGKTGMSRSESLFECQTYLESLIEGSKHVMHALGITLKDIKIAEDMTAHLRDEGYAD